MHDDISRYATTVKIDSHVSCKNQIYSNALIKTIIIQILYYFTCMYTYVGCTAKSDLKINDSFPSSFQEVNFEVKKKKKTVNIKMTLMQLVLNTKQKCQIVMTSTIFVGKCRPVVYVRVYGRTVTHSRVIFVRMAKLELDTHPITNLLINIIDYIIRVYNFVNKSG